MSDTPDPAARTTRGPSITEAEQHLATALRDGLCTDPLSQLGPHESGRAGQFRLRAWLPGSTAVPVHGRPMSLGLTLPPLGVVWFELGAGA